MSDRELLELAAKAAGIRYDDELSKPHPISNVWWGLWLKYEREPHELDRRYWNPLTDDGDAFRLAVKLNMTVSMNPAHAEAIWYDEELSVTRSLEQWDNGMEPNEWTRRCIVRAAAAIAQRGGA